MHNANRYGFSLVESLMAIAVIGVLGGIMLSAVTAIRSQARETQSASNIRQLAVANMAYAAEHGRYAPWSDLDDATHWHGARVGADFTGTGGFLSPYLEGGAVRFCPVLDSILDERSGAAFDEGTGGYGYNATYIGGDPALMDRQPPPGAKRGDIRPWWTVGRRPSAIVDPSRAVMFTSTAIARGGGLVETGNSVPYRNLGPGGLGGTNTATTHFRFNGRALVAWADGHVTFEEPNDTSAANVYGEDSAAYGTGWFGPTAWNGFWNPRSREGVAY